MKDWRILIVEDDLGGQEITSAVLEHHDIKVDVAGNAPTALQYLQDQTYTAVIIDLALPEIDGWELLNMIRQNPVLDTTPCFAMTAFHSTSVALRAREHGFAGYFPKPIDLDNFVTDIQNVILS